MLSNRIKFRHQLALMWPVGDKAVAGKQQILALFFCNSDLKESRELFSDFLHNSPTSCDL
jgi:hypothetical protein